MKVAVLPVVLLLAVLLLLVGYGLYCVCPWLKRSIGGGGWLQFRLRTLLIVVAIVGAALALWRQQLEVRELRSVVAAHGLAGGETDVTPETWRATVDDVITDEDFVIKLVTLETIGPAQITVTDGQGSLSQMATGPRSPASTRNVSRLAIIAALSEGPDPKRHTLRQCLRISQSGGYVGGPGRFSVSKDRPFEDLFSMHLEPGLYQRGQSVEVCRIDDRTWTLTVK